MGGTPKMLLEKLNDSTAFDSFLACLHLSYSIIKGDNSSGEYCESATVKEIGNFKGGENPEALEQKRHIFSVVKGWYNLNLCRE